LTFDFPTQIQEEGSVRFRAPRLEAFKRVDSEYAPSKAPVFYNPVMEMNRDLAVLALQSYQKKVERDLHVCEPLTGCGVRGIRFAKEVRGVVRVVLNDINPVAAELAQDNVRLNQIVDRVLVVNEDANLLLSRYSGPRNRFDFIDIDPFGSPAGYMDSALRSLKDNGLIALTATDMAPLCGVHPEVSLRKYGGRSLRTEYCQELAVRLLAGCLASTAARRDIGITPIFSHSSDHYIRVYALVSYGAKKANESIASMGYILHCFNCFHRETHAGLAPSLPERCEECGSPLKAAGPLWLGRNSDKEFCSSMLNDIATRHLTNERRISRLLSLIEAECDASATYYVVNKICDRLNLPVPRLGNVINGIEGVGYKALPTHFNKTGFRTDAPAKIVTDIITKS